MCNRDCCAVKTAFHIRRQKLLMEKLLKAQAANPPKIIPTPQSLILTYDDILEAAQFIIKEADMKPRYGLICGSNFDSIIERIENAIIIDYGDIPNFPLCVGEEQLGCLVMGTIMGADVMAMQGRPMLYEGTPIAVCAMPVRVMKFCGVEYVFITSSTGAVNNAYKVGDIMLVKDHINVVGMMGTSPLLGPNEPRFGKRHISMTNAYDKRLLHKAEEIGLEIGFSDNIHSGVYACLGGPVHETEAEQKLLHALGVDTVGMSLVHEVIVARHSGMKVFAFSLIVAPAFNHPKGPHRTIKAGLHACGELIARLIYDLENDL
ncbi:hypothetical protein KR222_007925, partial [Zaprionus bogoriensis]